MSETEPSDLPAVRKRAIRHFVKEIDATLAPHGYVRDNAGLWLRKGLFTRTYVQLQKSKYGDACFVNLGWKYNWEKDDAVTGDRQWRIGQLLDDTARANRLDQLPYTELDGEISPLRAEIIGLIRDIGVAHLRRFHSFLDRIRHS